MRREEIMVCEGCEAEFDPERDPDTSLPVNTLRCPKCGHKHEEKNFVLGGWVGIPEHKQNGREAVSNTPSGKEHKKAVYVIKSSMGPVKIGISKSPKSRKSSLTTGHPGELSIEALCYGCDADVAERQLHEKYSEYRMSGEWFDLPDEDEAELVSQVREGDLT